MQAMRSADRSAQSGNTKSFSFGSGGSFSQSAKSEPLFEKSSFFRKEDKESAPSKDVSIYHVGQKVSHPKYGEGQLIEISPDGLVGDIVFEDFGKKSLMLELAPLEILEG